MIKLSILLITALVACEQKEMMIPVNEKAMIHRSTNTRERDTMEVSPNDMQILDKMDLDANINDPPWQNWSRTRELIKKGVDQEQVKRLADDNV